MSKLFPELIKDQMRGCVVFLLAAVVMFILAACFCVGLSLLSSTGVDSDVVSAVTIIGLLCFLVIIAIGLPAGVFLVIRRRSSGLDKAFSPLGLTGSAYILTGRQYHGTYRERAVDVTYTRGPSLSIYVSTALMTRMNVGERDRAGRAIAGMLNRQPLTLQDPALSGLVVYALDETWTEELMTQPEAAALLKRLVMMETDFVLQQVHLQPEAFYLKLYRMKKFLAFSIDLDPEQVQAWVDDLIALAELAEAQEPPQQTVEASAIERRLRG